MHRNVLGLGYKIKNEKPAHDLKLRVSDSELEAMQLTYPSKARARREIAFQVRYLSNNNFLGLPGRRVRLLGNEDRFYSDVLTSWENRIP